jgi:acyl-CoA thioester hydrolase
MERGTATPFHWPVRVYYEDTDAQGLVYFANYFKYMERARTEWLRARGIEQDRLRAEENRLFVVVDTSASFIVPARFNEELSVSVVLEDLARASFQMAQEIRRGGPEGELLCSGTTRAACIKADSYRPARLPRILLEVSPG